MTEKSYHESAARVAGAVAESVKYQGRKASRQGSEQRRQAILDAAMRIIVRDGVRAVRHRAVAAEAAVPLSATTYYFKDINDLITDTFAQFVERSAEMLGAFWANMEDDLKVFEAAASGDRASRRRQAENMVEMAIGYVTGQLRENREMLLAEQAFRQEALLNPALRELAEAHRRILYRGVDQFFRIIGSAEPAQDAQILTALILRMEYQGLLDGADNPDLDRMRAVFKRYLYLVMGL
ncbi:TetR/AcrR family transcriptional regulator [Pseudomonas mangiferae]|uniref:TetR family transcriptional regulator n=1 Tax=Pseudomonas mangiferae TaxID=2593654 RepID=A0A553H1A9_9PSED|nr:TetR family transcriptional regulator [Pseudomonas mangiferae]TRX75526.1 TetR family transcriptional regulator [Pseudomonas mangiferae]